MTGYATCIHIILLMAGDTVAHFDINQDSARWLSRFPDSPMTFFTFQLANRNMSTMGEIHMNGILIESLPANIFFIGD